MSEVSAHDVCKLGQLWLQVPLKPAQRPHMAELPRWGQAVGSRGCHKDPGWWSAVRTKRQTLWASESRHLEVISFSPCPWAHRDRFKTKRGIGEASDVSLDMGCETGSCACCLSPARSHAVTHFGVWIRAPSGPGGSAKLLKTRGLNCM